MKVSRMDNQAAAPDAGNRLHQMTVSYSPQEDRLLLRFGTTGHLEYRLWLTRRLVRHVWETLVGAVEKIPEVSAQPERRVRQAVMSLRHHEAVQSGDFSQQRDPQAKPHPTNETPFLVTAVEVRRTEKASTVVVFKVEKGQDVQLLLDEKLIHALCHLLVSGAEKAEWKLGLAMAGPDVLAVTASDRLH